MDVGCEIDIQTALKYNSWSIAATCSLEEKV